MSLPELLTAKIVLRGDAAAVGWGLSCGVPVREPLHGEGLAQHLPEGLLCIAEDTREFLGLLVQLSLEGVAKGALQGHKGLRHLAAAVVCEGPTAWLGAHSLDDDGRVLDSLFSS